MSQCATTLVALLAFAVTARAQVSEERLADYRSVAERGVAAFNENDLAAARQHFERATEILPNPRVHRLLGRVALAEGNHVEAAQLFHRALSAEDAGHPLSERLRRQVETELLPEARAHVAEYRVELEPADAILRVDGEAAVLVGDRLILDPGAHAVVAEAPGFETLRERLQAEAGDREVLRLRLEATGRETEPAALAIDPSPESSEPPGGGEGGPSPAALGLVIGGGLVTVVGAVFVGVGWSDADRAHNTQFYPDVEAADLRAQWMIPLGYVTAGVGLAAAVAGIVLFSLGIGEEEQASLSVTPWGIDLRGRF